MNPKQGWVNPCIRLNGCRRPDQNRSMQNGTLFCLEQWMSKQFGALCVKPFCTQCSIVDIRIVLFHAPYVLDNCMMNAQKAIERNKKSSIYLLMNNPYQYLTLFSFHTERCSTRPILGCSFRFYLWKLIVNPISYSYFLVILILEVLHHFAY